jgi:hypothetical protein
MRLRGRASNFISVGYKNILFCANAIKIEDFALRAGGYKIAPAPIKMRYGMRSAP